MRPRPTPDQRLPGGPAWAAAGGKGQKGNKGVMTPFKFWHLRQARRAGMPEGGKR